MIETSACARSSWHNQFKEKTASKLDENKQLYIPSKSKNIKNLYYLSIMHEDDNFAKQKKTTKKQQKTALKLDRKK